MDCFGYLDKSEFNTTLRANLLLFDIKRNKPFSILTFDGARHDPPPIVAASPMEPPMGVVVVQTALAASIKHQLFLKK